MATWFVVGIGAVLIVVCLVFAALQN